MFEKILTVKYTNLKTSFCYLGPNTTKELGANVLVKITHEDDKETYYSVGPPSALVTDGNVGINSVFAKLLGIEENSSVILSEIGSVPRVESFTIHPVRYEDFHVLDLLKNEVENCLLRQTTIVQENQGLVIWIGQNINIPVRIVSVSPASPGVLDNLTELVILPNMKETNVEPSKESNISTDTIKQKTIDANIFHIPLKLTKSELENERKFQMYSHRKESFNGRLVPFDCLNFPDVTKYLYEFSVFLLKSKAPLTWKKQDSFKEPILCSLGVTNRTDAKMIFVRVYLIEGDSVISNNIFVHDNLLSILDCKIGASVLLKVLRIESGIEEIVIHRKDNKRNVKDLLTEFLANICQHQEFVLNSDIPMVLNNDTHYFLTFKPNSLKYCWVTNELLRNCKYTIEEDPSIMKLPVQVKTKAVDFIGMTCHQSICDSIMKNLKFSLKQGEPLSCSLVIGNSGSGKSVLIEKLSSIMLDAPFYVYSEIVKCKSLKGKTLDSLHKVFTTIFEDLLAHQPSILFIDDLHVLCENIAESDAQAQNVLYYNRISEMIYLLFKSVTSYNSIGIIATSESEDKLNRNIYSSRGCYLFEDVHIIEELKKSDRNIILDYLLKNYRTEIDIENLSQKTDGYVFQDLFDLVQKVVFQSIKDDPDNIFIKEVHCESALSQMTILSLNNVKLHSSGDRDFSNVGGLVDVKMLLNESLQWPLKYSNLFDSAPLRLQSGLLLYGPPGTGKTLIAGAAAKQFGIRLISIKGPELLSKYIGASEQAVRDVFVQAQHAKPCILFFDEFDSLAPRRGHDITGVTDRVVNQLLTQMDGVESLTGVCVIAATSRPDLLDPALLRPGRLDRQIFCSLPDRNSRLDILKVLSDALVLSEDVDLEEIADKSEGFSGADMQSLLYSAQLSTMEHLLVSEDNKDIEEIHPISHEVLKKSLAKTRPSLTEQEKKKYDYIYSKFQGKADIDYLRPGTRASLA